MSLERFRRTRMVVLTGRATSYQAARAMMDNHIGSVLISEARGLSGIVTDRDLALAVLGGDLDPKTTTLNEVMSEDVVTCDIGADVDEVVRLMRENNIRRIPLTEHGQLIGLITFDDLVVSGAVSLDALRSIVTAQLEVEAPHKPAGLLYPEGPGQADQRPVSRARALMRAKARADGTYDRFLAAIGTATKLDRDRSERAVLLSLCMLCRRLTPQEAQDLIAQLPSKLQPGLGKCLDGPDRGVSAEVMRNELARVLSIETDNAEAVLAGIFKTLVDNVSAGQIAEIRGQLPEGMKALFPSAST